MIVIQPPTSHLPPIAKIATFSPTQLSESLQYLHSLYRPQVRGSRRRRQRVHERSSLRPVLSSGGHDDHNSDDDDVQQVRFDAFERAYAVRWLTALIAQLDIRQDQFPSSCSDSDFSIGDDTLMQQAASLLATCAGVAAAPKLHRRFSFESPVLPSVIGGVDPDEVVTRTVHVDLTDIPLDNHDYASVGAQTWGGACVLAEMIAERPDRFGLGCATSARWDLSASSDSPDTRNTDRPPPSGGHPLRILELGAGTGLVGLTVAKLLQVSLPPSMNPSSNPDQTSHPLATIVLTDFYPAALANLQSNIDANFPTTALGKNASDHHHATIAVYSHPLDWSSFSSTTKTSPIPDILSTPFDLVFGADIVYEAHHAVWIRDCLTSLLSYADGSNEDPAFHLVIPLRSTHTFESSTVEEVFGCKDRGSEGSQRELTILSKETVICEAYGGEGSERSRTDDDVEYTYYRIGWTG